MRMAAEPLPGVTAPAAAREARAGELPPLDARIERAYTEHFDALSRYARVLASGDEAQAEDLVHAVFFSLVRAEREGRWPAEVRSYLFGALIRLDRSRRRDAARRNEAFWNAYGRMLRSIKREDEKGSQAENVAALIAALRELPEELREVILRVHAGLAFREIAEALDIPEKTARSRYYTALERLRIRLKED